VGAVVDVALALLLSVVIQIEPAGRVGGDPAASLSVRRFPLGRPQRSIAFMACGV
jgi:hypothetical protein